MADAGVHAENRPTFVVDTSVLLGDPFAMGKFGDASVVLPVVVIGELESKRHHPELGWAARTALRALEQLRIEHGSLTNELPINDEGGTVRVELNHQELSLLPPALTDDTNDHRILAVGKNLASEGLDVTIVSKDLPLRLKASVAGLRARESVTIAKADEFWSGVIELDVPHTLIDELYSDHYLDRDEFRELPANAGLVLHAGRQSALARKHADGVVRQVRTDHELFGVRGRSAEQRLALDLLSDDSVPIVSLGGNAGTGKSALAIAAGLEAVLERRTHKRVLVFRPLFAVGGQDLGYLPGTEAEKMAPWAAAVQDVLESITTKTVVEEVMSRNLMEVLPLTHIRGRSLSDTFVIIDEAQNLERPVLLTALSRLGEGCKVVLTHDVAQRDNLRVGRHDGIAAVIDALEGHPLFGHITFRRSERGPVAELVASLLDVAGE
jgi:PhoH-like ATPase